jgi:hypothetical protein
MLFLQKQKGIAVTNERNKKLLKRFFILLSLLIAGYLYANYPLQLKTNNLVYMQKVQFPFFGNNVEVLR